MIIVRFTSGLGNQMFQYNFYRLMQETYPETEVLADLTWFYANDDHHGFELRKLFEHAGSEFALCEASAAQIFRVTGQIPNLCRKHANAFERFRRYPNRLLRPLFGASPKKNIINLMEAKIDFEAVMRLDLSQDWYLIGFWIEDCYFGSRIARLQRELVFDENYSEENAALAREITACESVSIHVRRGDYLTVYADRFCVLGREYYEKAVDVIRKVYALQGALEPRFYLFSDDSDFLRKEFDWLERKVIVDCNTGEDSFRDMQLMSLCKHNIIANSTFSAWAAILNRNPNHFTLYPAAYLMGEDSEEKRLSGWVRI